MKKHEFKVEDWVKASRKTTNPESYHLFLGDYPTGIFKIHSIYHREIVAKGLTRRANYFFNPSDLKPYTGEFICDHAEECTVPNTWCSEAFNSDDYLSLRGIDKRTNYVDYVDNYADDCLLCKECKAIPYQNLKEEPRQKKYEAIREFTVQDFIIAHQEDYEWSSFYISCIEFQEDVIFWGDEYEDDRGDGDTINEFICNPKFSHYFIRHLIKYGFIKEKEVEPEVFYSQGDRFLRGFEEEEWMISYAGNRMGHNHCHLTNLSNGSRLYKSYSVGNTQKITVQEFKKISFGQKFILKARANS